LNTFTTSVTQLLRGSQNQLSSEMDSGSVIWDTAT
jgi:hypothetical protein